MKIKMNFYFKYEIVTIYVIIFIIVRMVKNYCLIIIIIITIYVSIFIIVRMVKNYCLIIIIIMIIILIIID